MFRLIVVFYFYFSELFDNQDFEQGKKPNLMNTKSKLKLISLHISELKALEKGGEGSG